MKNSRKTISPVASKLLVKVANDYNVSLGTLLSPSRKFELMDARTIIGLVLFGLGYTKSSIGDVLNRKDHTTIISLLNRGNKREDLKAMAGKYKVWVDETLEIN